MKPLRIVWQRLVNSGGQTCDRCGGTYDALQRAIAKLEDALGPLGLEPTLETKEIDEGSFKADPLCIQPNLDCGSSPRAMARGDRRRQSVLFSLWRF